MSGPKLSAAEIEAQRRAQLERERRERLRILREAQGRHSVAKAKVEALKQQLSRELSNDLVAIREVSPAGAAELEQTIMHYMSQMVMTPISNTSSEQAWDSSAANSLQRAQIIIEQSREEIRKEAERVGVVSGFRTQMEKKLRDRISSIQSVSAAGAKNLSDAIDRIMAQMDIMPTGRISSPSDLEKQLDTLLQKGESIIQKELQRIGVFKEMASSASAKAGITDEATMTARDEVKEHQEIEFVIEKPESIRQRLEESTQEIRVLFSEGDIPMKKTAEAVIEEAEVVAKKLNDNADNALKKEAQSIINRQQDLRDEVSECKELYDTYCALAAIVDEEALPLAKFDNAEAIEKEIHDLNCRYQRKDEMDYTADQINQVMLDLGYDFVSSHVLQEETEKDVSLYGVDDQTGVVVYTGENGEVMMQVACLGDSEELSDAEIEDNLEMQISFCAAHQDIVDELAKRGVLLRQKSYLPPARTHARKICIANQSIESRKMVARRKRRYEQRKAMRSM